MAVHCSKCGEELIGAVNRCWRCGHEFPSRPGPADLPPVRRAPIDGPIDAVIDEAGAGSEAQAVAEQAAQAGAEGDERPPAASPPMRVGSPFRERGSPPVALTSGGPVEPAVAVADKHAPAQRPQYPRHASAIGGAIACLVLGLISLVGAFLTNGALVTGILGIGMGVWGLYSVRRGVAIAGLLLCCIALAIAGFNSVVDLYESIYDESPFGSPVDVLEAPEDDLLN